MGSVPLLAQSIQQPPSILDQVGKVVQLQSLLQQQKAQQQQMQTEQQLAPYRVSEAQATSGQAQLQYKNSQLLFGALSDPDLWSDSDSTSKQPQSTPAKQETPQTEQTTPTGVPATPVVPTGGTTSVPAPTAVPTSLVSKQPTNSGGFFNPETLMQRLIQRKVPPALAMQVVQPVLDFDKAQLEMSKDNQDSQTKTLEQLGSQMQPIKDETDPAKQKALIDSFEDDFNTNPQSYPGLTPQQRSQLQTLPQAVGHPDILNATLNSLGLMTKIAEAHQKQAEATTAQITADREAKGYIDAQNWTPEKSESFVESQLPNSKLTPDQGGIAPGLRTSLLSEGKALYDHALSSTGSLKEADAALAPWRQKIQTLQTLGPQKQAEMEATMRAGMQLNAATAAQQVEYVKAPDGTVYPYADAKKIGGFGPNAQFINANLTSGRLPMGKVTLLDPDTAQSVRGLQGDLNNVDDLEKMLSKYQPKSAGGRLLKGPENTIGKLLQTNDLDSLGAFQESGVKTLKDIISSGGGAGMRGMTPQMIKMANNSIPEPSDTLDVAQSKIKNLRTVTNNLLKSYLDSGTKPTQAPATPTQAATPPGWIPGPAATGNSATGKPPGW